MELKWATGVITLLIGVIACCSPIYNCFLGPLCTHQPPNQTLSQREAVGPISNSSARWVRRSPCVDTFGVKTEKFTRKSTVHLGSMQCDHCRFMWIFCEKFKLPQPKEFWGVKLIDLKLVWSSSVKVLGLPAKGCDTVDGVILHHMRCIKPSK